MNVGWYWSIWSRCATNSVTWCVGSTAEFQWHTGSNGVGDWQSNRMWYLELYADCPDKLVISDTQKKPRFYKALSVLHSERPGLALPAFWSADLGSIEALCFKNSFVLEPPKGMPVPITLALTFSCWKTELWEESLDSFLSCICGSWTGDLMAKAVKIIHFGHFEMSIC